MASNFPQSWRICTVDEIKADSESAVAIGPFGSRMRADSYVEHGIPVIRGNNISDTKMLSGDFVCVSREKAKELSSCNVKDGDLVFPHRGLIGEVGLVTGGPNAHYILSTSLMKLTLNKNIADPLFFFYFFRSPKGRHELLKNASQVGTPGIATPLSSLRSIRVPLPPVSEQQAIAHVLGTVDDKIELNRRMNETLEAMARAIFRSWFVDFGPVRAKVEGREPFGMDAETASLFADSFQDSPLGKIPKGWEVAPILARAKLLSGGTPRTECKHYWNGEILWASAKDVSQCRDTFLVRTDRTITERGLAESAAQIIPEFCTVVVARGATTGRMVLLGREMAMNQTCYALGTTTKTPYSLYCLLQHEMEKLVHTGHGSVFNTITTSTFASSRVVLPPQLLVEAFEAQVAPFFERLLTGIAESLSLAAIRDALVPKLISGEIRVKDAEVRLSEST
jgi:type I restriction enzyme S subunit